MIVLGFDFGTKYIGVAIGQSITNSAKPITTIKNKKNGDINWQEVTELIKQWKPDQLVVGIPLNLDDQEQSITYKCLDFAKQLKSKFQLIVHHVDERYSTWEAKQQLLCNNPHHYSQQQLLDINAMAASILVKQWLEENKNG